MTAPLDPHHAVYVGSFDPPTLGHIDVVRRGRSSSLVFLLSFAKRKPSPLGLTLLNSMSRLLLLLILPLVALLRTPSSPMVDIATRRAAMLNRISGRAVTGPEANSSAVSR